MRTLLTLASFAVLALLHFPPNLRPHFIAVDLRSFSMYRGDYKIIRERSFLPGSEQSGCQRTGYIGPTANKHTSKRRSSMREAYNPIVIPAPILDFSLVIFYTTSHITFYSCLVWALMDNWVLA